MTATAAAEVELDVRDAVATVTLNRPDKLNAVTPGMAARIGELLRSCDADPAVRAIVLTGRGRGFCSGADLAVIAGGVDALAGFVTDPSTFPVDALTVRKPVIAAINGPVAGVGIAYIAAADVRFASSEARFTTSFARLGLVAEYGLAWLLPRLIGRTAAADLLLSGRTIDAAEALRIGLVTAVIDPGLLLEHATRYARELGQRCSPRSLAVIKGQLLTDADGDRASSFDRSVRLMLDSFTAPDLTEAIAASQERRKPRFPPLEPGSLGVLMNVHIAGVGLHPFGRFPLAVEELGRAAAIEALADAGVSYPDVDLTVVANVGEGMAKGQRIAERLGATGRPVLSVESACASSTAALLAGRDAIESGRAGIVLCLGVEKAPRGFIAGAGFEPWQEASGVGVTPIYFALQAQELLAATGGTVQDLAAVSVKNHGNGALNPNAMYRSPVTAEEVLRSKMVCPPLNLLMLCAPNEGAAAVVLMSAEQARRRGVAQPVAVRAVALATRSPGDWFIPAPSRLSEVRSSPTLTAAAAAYQEAGLGPGDLDLVECQDTDAASELIAYADLGLCAAGDEVKLLRGGDTQLGGRIPVNPSGGLLSKGEPLGASGLGQVHELVVQLRGQAGPRQVSGARIGLAHVMGAGHVSAVTILAAA